MRRRCFSHPCRFPTPSSHPLPPPPTPSPFRSPSTLLPPSFSPSSPSFSPARSLFSRAFRFLFSIFTLGSSERHGPERGLKSEQHRDDTTTNVTEQRKWGRLQLVLTYVLYSLSVCYFRLNVCFPASRVYLHRRLAPYSLMNLFFRAVPLHPSEARLESLKIGDISSRRRRKKWSKNRVHLRFHFFLVENFLKINQGFSWEARAKFETWKNGLSKRKHWNCKLSFALII